jgi:Zn-dependent protease
VFLIEPGPTQFDLRFRLFGIHVRVHPMFWVISAVLGWPAGGPERYGNQFLPLVGIWLACVFVSVLVHELGHVLVGRLFGSQGHIVLYSMGGLAIGSSNLDRRWQRIAVYAAGPAAGFLLLGLAYGGLLVLGVRERDMPRLARVAYGDVIWINLAWGLVNLLPIWPLDGGQISRDLCSGVWRERGVRMSLGLSTVVAGLIAAHAAALQLSEAYQERVVALVEQWGGWSSFLLGLGGWYVALFFGLMALSSFMALQHLERRQREWDDHWQD